MYWRILLMLAAATDTPLRAEDRPAQAGDFIEVFQGLFGEHRDERKGHAKGVCAVGSFTGSAATQIAPLASRSKARLTAARSGLWSKPPPKIK